MFVLPVQLLLPERTSVLTPSLVTLRAPPASVMVPDQVSGKLLAGTATPASTGTNVSSPDSVVGALTVPPVVLALPMLFPPRKFIVQALRSPVFWKNCAGMLALYVI